MHNRKSFMSELLINPAKWQLLNTFVTDNWAKVYVNQCSFGRGIFAATDIKKGEVILNFTGTVINLSQALTKDDDNLGNPLQIDTETYIDIEEPGVLINHHCEPNAGIINTNTLIALTNIVQDTQIFYDYSTTMSDGLWTMSCGCSSIHCRKTIEDFHFLPELLKEKYLRMGIVQNYIVREYEQRQKVSQVCSH